MAAWRLLPRTHAAMGTDHGSELDGAEHVGDSAEAAEDALAPID